MPTISLIMAITLTTAIWTANAVLAVVIVSQVVVYLTGRRREDVLERRLKKDNDRLALILEASKVRLWTYDVPTQHFTWLSQGNTQQREYSTIDFARRYSRDDFDRLREQLRRLANDETDRATLELDLLGRADDDTNDQERNTRLTLSILHRDEEGRPKTLLATRSDITEDRQRQQKVRDTRVRYEAIFNTAMIDMAYFGPDGHLQRVNQKACLTHGIEIKQLNDMNPSVYDLLGMTPDEMPLDHFPYFYATQLLNHGLKKPFEQQGMHSKCQYCELQLLPLYNSKGQLQGIFSTGRDVTEVVTSYHQQQQAIKRIHAATNEVMDYIDNIDLTLKAGGLRIAAYSPTDHVLTIYSSIGHVERSYTQAQTLQLIDQGSLADAMRIFSAMDSRTTVPLQAEILTKLQTRDNQQLYLHYEFVPDTDDEGNIRQYMGMCRDITKLKLTVQQLEVETAKAQEVEAIKNTFLRNMSFEIRTPLNAVVGFAELFDHDHTPEEEQIFISEIKTNSAQLLHLINSILFLSRLDAHMIDINPQPIDFVPVFDTACRLGWEKRQREGVRYIVETPYETLNVTVDAPNLSLVVEQVVTNAVQHTTTGNVVARCDYVADQLLITVSDTGSGIAAEAMEHLYERFGTGSGHGSGLGLSICRELLQQMGGAIRVKSTPGQGTTVWVTLPCQANEIIRKK